jgi:hypothetical protein
MNIIERNFYRLLRSGAFGTTEQIEPLSAWKWNRLYQLALMHDVATMVYQGILCCQEQFFVQPPTKLMKLWKESTTVGSDENDLLQSDHLTNPLLNHQLQNILDSTDSNIETRSILLHLLGIVRFIMNAGIPVKRVMELGLFIRESGKKVDYEKLHEWIVCLHLEPMLQLTAVMLVRMMHFDPDELPLMQPISNEEMNRQIKEMFHQKNSHPENWYFSQGKNIFVHTSNSRAMLWHIRRSTHYFRYFPLETVTNFFTTFAHSLSHIEE